MKNSAKWITQTAVMLALLIGVQAATSFLTPPVTGSLVNLILIVTVIISGLSSGLAVAAVSPFAAKLLGIGPLWEIIPFIVLGNLVLVIIWHFICALKFSNKHAVRCAALVSAAVCKFLTLYISVVKIAVPLLLSLPEKQAATVSALFSFQQLFTALIGGGLAVIILPMLEKIKIRD